MQKQNQRISNYQGGDIGQCLYRQKDTKQYYCDTSGDENGNSRLNILGKLIDYMNKNPSRRDEIE